MRKSKVLRNLRQLADKYGFEFVCETKLGHYKWRHTANNRILFTVSNDTSFHTYKNTEQTMRMVANGSNSHAH